ncbi:MAG: hypothetical protein HY298_05770 [Verrucomicrobia bacterium]|nr:hypothetical protein [Verrucomicrobiota bacterium]
MKIQIVKELLALIGAATLLVGCATPDHRAAGGMGNESQTMSGRGSNASAFSDNPFSFGAGSGISRAH